MTWIKSVWALNCFIKCALSVELFVAAPSRQINRINSDEAVISHQTMQGIINNKEVSQPHLTDSLLKKKRQTPGKTWWCILDLDSANLIEQTHPWTSTGSLPVRRVFRHPLFFPALLTLWNRLSETRCGWTAPTLKRILRWLAIRSVRQVIRVFVYVDIYVDTHLLLSINSTVCP